MTDIKITNKQLSFIYETTYNTDPIDANSTETRFGRYTLVFGEYSSAEIALIEYYSRASREVNAIAVASKKYQRTFLCDVISGVLFHKFSGSVSDSSGTKTITANTLINEKPSFTSREVRKSNTITEIDHLTGCKLKVLITTADYISGGVLKHIGTFFAAGRATSPYSGDKTPVHPTGVTNLPFDILSVFSWDTAGTPEDLKDVVAEFALVELDTGAELEQEIDALTTDRQLDNQFVYTLTIKLLAGKTNTLTAYHNSYDNDTTPIDLQIKQAQRTGSNYITLDLTGLVPFGLITRSNQNKKQDFDEYNFKIMSISKTVLDGAANSFYKL